MWTVGRPCSHAVFSWRAPDLIQRLTAKNANHGPKRNSEEIFNDFYYLEEADPLHLAGKWSI
jgi:hypothetical protein